MGRNTHLDNSNGGDDMMSVGNIEPYCSNGLENCGRPPSGGPLGDETVTIVWPKKGSASGYLPSGNCTGLPPNPINLTTLDLAWQWEVRDMTGGTWYHGQSLLTEDLFDPVCVIPGANGLKVGNMTLVPAMTQDSTIAPLVHVFLSQSIFFNGTGLPADWRGTRIMHSQINLSSGASASPMEELSPVTSVFGCGGGTCPLCTSRPGHSHDECFAQQFYPSAASLVVGKMAVAWHDTRLTPHNWSDSASSGGPGTGAPPAGAVYPNIVLLDAPQGVHSNTYGLFGTWGFPIVTEQLASGVGVPFRQLGNNGGNTAWGDYEGMAVDAFTGSFYSIWGDARNLTPAICPNLSSGCSTTLFTTRWVP
jgi:hypothetical protein